MTSGKAESFHPEFGLEGALHRSAQELRGRAVVYGDTDECATGVEVMLEGDGSTTLVLTDGFGDFEFERLPPAKDYTVKVAAEGYAAQQLHVRTNASVYLGDIVLQSRSGGDLER